MSFNIAGYFNLNAYSGTSKISDGKYAKQQEPSFFDVLVNHLPRKGPVAFTDSFLNYTPDSRDIFADAFLNYKPDKKVSFADEARAIVGEKRMMLIQLIERMRIENEAKRLELLSKILEKKEEPYDIMRKCLEIAARIMRGEKVTAEEMRLLSQHFPELLFQALLLRKEEANHDHSNDEDPVNAVESLISDYTDDKSIVGDTGAV